MTFLVCIEIVHIESCNVDFLTGEHRHKMLR